MATIDTLISARVNFPKPYSTPIKSFPKRIHPSNLTRKFRPRTPFLHRSFTVLCELQSSQSGGDTSKPKGDDFVTRVLKENPSQVEPRYLVGNKIYTLKEKEDLRKGNNLGLIEILKKKLNTKSKSKNETIGGERETETSENDYVYLNDILREYKGKLYVPEQIFGAELSEEEEFEKNLEELPKMSLEDFRKAMKSGKVKLLTSKEVSGVSYVGRYWDFVVDLEDIPGDKSLQRTKW